jgi:F-type H+-transporting ATPase subunit delta
MITGSLARRYARALMDIGLEAGTYEALGADVRRFAAAFAGSEELSSTLSNPAFPRADRRAVIEQVLLRLGAAPVVRNFLLLLLDRERIAHVGDISRELDAFIDREVGRIRATVTAAQPLTPSQELQLRKSLEALSGKRVEMETHHDPELLGGVVAQVGDLLYDGSLRTQLARMRERLAAA